MRTDITRPDPMCTPLREYWLGRGIEQNDARAQYDMYVFLDGPRNNKNNRLLMEAAMNGNHSAQYMLGQAYREGTHFQRDLTKAKVWLTKAANQGNTYAMIDLSDLLFQTRTKRDDVVDALKFALLADKRWRIEKSLSDKPANNLAALRLQISKVGYNLNVLQQNALNKAEVDNTTMPLYADLMAKVKCRYLSKER